jgi:hypothetical protein
MNLISSGLRLFSAIIPYSLTSSTPALRLGQQWLRLYCQAVLVLWLVVLLLPEPQRVRLVLSVRLVLGQVRSWGYNQPPSVVLLARGLLTTHRRSVRCTKLLKTHVRLMGVQHIIRAIQQCRIRLWVGHWYHQPWMLLPLVA